MKYHNCQVLARIHEIRDTSQNVEKNLQKDATHEEDDDTLRLPLWMLEKLHVKPGEPLCLTFDLAFSRDLSA